MRAWAHDPWFAHTQYDYARTLTDRSENAERAHELLADCRRTANELGMRALLERVSRLEKFTRLGGQTA